MENDLCLDCGECCKFEKFTITDIEYQQIKSFLNRKIHKNKQGMWKFTNGKTSCPALSERGCKIPHEIRPYVCRMFPFIVESFDVPLKFSISLHCPKNIQFKKLIFGDNDLATEYYTNLLADFVDLGHTHVMQKQLVYKNSS